MIPTLTSLAPAAADGLTEACGDNPHGLCKWIYDRWGNEALATTLTWLVNRPLRIVVIVAIAIIATALLRRAIERFTHRITSDDSRVSMRRITGSRLVNDPNTVARATARAQTLSTVLRGLVTATVWTIAAMLIFGEIGLNLGPLIAGAGIAGVALGFGAQRIVQDFLSGFFMLVEDQFGVGDVVDVGPVSGTVERVTLRTTVLRDVNGSVWHVPNGEIRRVGNKSQLWSRAVLDISVAYDTDLRVAQGVIQRVADELWGDEGFRGGVILEQPEVWGVESLGSDAIDIRLVVKTDPADQWIVARELRLRIKEAFDEAGIEIPFGQQTVWLRNGEPSPAKPGSTPPAVKVAPIHRSATIDLPPPDTTATG